MDAVKIGSIIGHTAAEITVQAPELTEQTQQRASPLPRGLVIYGKMALIEGATLCILTSQAHRVVALVQALDRLLPLLWWPRMLLEKESTKCQLLSSCPVHPAVWCFKHLPADDQGSRSAWP